MIIAIDFDGTCVTHEYPEIGYEIGAVPVLKKLVAHGHKLILWTMRSDFGSVPLIGTEKEIEANFLTEAVNWFKKHEIPLFGIQRNPEQDSWTTSPKAYAQLYIDDAALGCPLVTIYGQRPYVDWMAVDILLKGKGLYD
jgi:hypothetical protein